MSPKCPFVYYGIHDDVDLREIPWRRGRGYDVEALSNLLTSNDAWANQVLAQLVERVDDAREIRALGFCVSVDHARFMAPVFNRAGVAAAVWADSPAEERRSALSDLAARRVNVVFSVDLYNEGIDVPTVDTLLLLRPTDSPTLFLQQLGRGLRLCHGKTVCTVLDFVGHHRKEFRFDRRFRALLGGSRKELVEQIRSGFPFLPAGCHMELDPVASEDVLENIREAIPSRWTARVEELRSMAASGGSVSLAVFLEETGLDLSDVYTTGPKTWSDLCAEAGFEVQPPGPHEEIVRRACGRLLHVDDLDRIEQWRSWLARDSPPDPDALPVRKRRQLRMLVASIGEKALGKAAGLGEGFALIWAHPQVRAELLELLDVLASRIDHVHRRLDVRPEVPLEIHARYSRLEILAAFGVGEGAKAAPWQSGVWWAKESRSDLLAFTLDKTSGRFSPTTRYRDYAISRELIHWESQSTTREESETGRRYRSHVAEGSCVMLFARLRADDRAFWFLGPATYVQHESELPMRVTWRLDHPLPGDLFARFAAAVA